MTFIMERFFIVVIAALHFTIAVKPPNYIEKPKVPDKYPPKYEYNYFVANRHNQAAQGHKEIRNGDNTAGNYFVNLPKGESKTVIDYIADEWGFWPITRYLTNGPHHRTHGHFALGQHAVERLNQTRLNTNEFFINQNSIQPQQQQQQQLADASISTPQITSINSHKTLPLNTKLFPINNHRQELLLKQQNQPVQFQQLYKNHHKPMIYQPPQQIPLIYEHNQFPQNPPIYQPPILPPPHEIIYHQQPMLSMAEFPSFLPTIVPLIDPPLQEKHQQVAANEQHSESSNVKELQSDLLIKIDDDKSVVTPNQLAAKIQDDNLKEQFNGPIVVNEDDTINIQQKNIQQFENYQHQPQINVKILTDASTTTTIESNGKNSNNFQYLVDDDNGDQDLVDSTQSSKKEAPSRQFLRNFKKFNAIESTTVTTSDGGKKSCCDVEKEVKVTSQKPISNSYLAPVHVGLRLTNEKLDDCIDGHTYDKIVEVRKNVDIKQSFVTTTTTTRKTPTFGDRIVISTPPTPFAATNQPKAILISSAPPKVTVVTKQQPIYISTPAPPPTVVTKVVDRPVYIKSPPEIIEKVVHHPIIKEQPIFIEKIIKQNVEVDRPVYIKSPPETKIVQQPIVVEKQVLKEVLVPVEKTKIVHQPILKTVEKPVFIEKIVKQPEIVEKIVEKPVFKTVEKFIDRPIIQTVEKIVEKPIIQTVDRPVIVEKIVDRPIEKIVEKPVTVEKFIDRPIVQTVEKFIEKPIYIEKIVEKPVIQTIEKEKIVDRPVAVPYAVPFEKHVYHKPDFHVIAKAIPHKHKLFDFEALLGFLTNKQEVKHIYVPANPQYQLSQFNKHHLLASTYSTIDSSVKENNSPLIDYTRYATSHLNPIKPVYGVPSTVLKPITSSGYSAPDPYGGNFAYQQQQHSAWAYDSIPSQSQITSVHKDNYVGPTPQSDDYWAINGVSTKDGIKFRRNIENGRSLRIEYGGFFPKINPSVEIDQNGTPIKKEVET